MTTIYKNGDNTIELSNSCANLFYDRVKCKHGITVNGDYEGKKDALEIVSIFREHNIAIPEHFNFVLEMEQLEKSIDELSIMTSEDPSILLSLDKKKVVDLFMSERSKLEELLIVERFKELNYVLDHLENTEFWKKSFNIENEDFIEVFIYAVRHYKNPYLKKDILTKLITKSSDNAVFIDALDEILEIAEECDYKLEDIFTQLVKKNLVPEVLFVLENQLLSNPKQTCHQILGHGFTSNYKHLSEITDILRSYAPEIIS